MCFLTVKDDEDVRETPQIYGSDIIFLHTTVEVFQPERAENVEPVKQRGPRDFRL